MQIDLTIRVTYFGPMKDMVEYSEEQAVVEGTVPWALVDTFTITNEEIKASALEFTKALEEKLPTEQSLKDALASVVADGTISQPAADILGANASSDELNASIAKHALKMVNDNPTKYCGDSGPAGTNRQNLWDWGDCSSWIWAVFASHPSKPNSKMGPTWNSTFESKKNIPATNGQIDSMRNGSCPCKEIFYSRGNTTERKNVITPKLKDMKPGDLIFRKEGVVKEKGHVAIVTKNDSEGGGVIEYAHCGGPRPKPSSVGAMNYWEVAESYTECYRPMLGNPDTPGNRVTDPLIMDSVT